MLLNEDCFLAIFSYLSLMDLFAVKHCCQKFSALADIAANETRRSEVFRCNLGRKLPKNILKCYGSRMKGVIFEENLDQTNSKKEENCLLLRRCTSLKSLTISESPLFYDHASVKIYEGLKSLTISQCPRDRSIFDQMMRACKNLKSLEMNEYMFQHGTFDSLSTLINIERISITKGYLVFLANLAPSVAKLQALKKLKYLKIDLLTCLDCVLVVNELDKIASLAQLELSVNFISDGFTEAVDALRNVTFCQIHYLYSREYGDFDEHLFSDSITNFNVEITRKKWHKFHKHDIKLHRKN